MTSLLLLSEVNFSDNCSPLLRNFSTNIEDGTCLGVAASDFGELPSDVKVFNPNTSSYRDSSLSLIDLALSEGQLFLHN